MRNILINTASFVLGSVAESCGLIKQLCTTTENSLRSLDCWLQLQKRTNFAIIMQHIDGRVATVYATSEREAMLLYDYAVEFRKELQWIRVDIKKKTAKSFLFRSNTKDLAMS